MNSKPSPHYQALHICNAIQGARVLIEQGSIPEAESILYLTAEMAIALAESLEDMPHADH